MHACGFDLHWVSAAYSSDARSTGPARRGQRTRSPLSSVSA